MADKTNVRALYAPSEVSDFEALQSVNEEIKALEVKKQELVGRVKAHMQGKNVTAAELDGYGFTLIPSSRRMIARGQKDNLVAELVNDGKKHLVTYSIEPDLDSIFAEVNAGRLSQDIIDKYIKVTDVITLRCG